MDEQLERQLIEQANQAAMSIELKPNFDSFLNTFKVDPCPVQQECKDAFCQRYHGKSDRRRNLNKSRYINVLCNYQANCYYYEDCKFAHNFTEFFYHPNVYKKYQCQLSSTVQKCPMQNICWGLHQDEIFQNVIQPNQAIEEIFIPQHQAIWQNDIQQYQIIESNSIQSHQAIDENANQQPQAIQQNNIQQYQLNESNKIQPHQAAEQILIQQPQAIQQNQQHQNMEQNAIQKHQVIEQIVQSPIDENKQDNEEFKEVVQENIVQQEDSNQSDENNSIQIKEQGSIPVQRDFNQQMSPRYNNLTFREIKAKLNSKMTSMLKKLQDEQNQAYAIAQKVNQVEKRKPYTYCQKCQSLIYEPGSNCPTCSYSLISLKF